MIRSDRILLSRRPYSIILIRTHKLGPRGRRNIMSLGYIEQTSKQLGRLGVLVNNAGVLLDPPRHPPDAEGASAFNASLDYLGQLRLSGLGPDRYGRRHSLTAGRVVGSSGIARRLSGERALKPGT